MEIERSVRNLLAPVWEDGRKLRVPLYLQFEITSRCNLMCRMCYIASNCEENRKKELPASKWLDISRQARDMGLMIVNITGGEPIMKDDFWELHDGLTKLGVIYTLNTNGTMMTKENVKRLAQAPPFRALVSIYGGSEDTYAKITTSGKWFDQARAGVENLLEAGIQTVIRMTLIKENIDDIPKVFEWADSLGQNLFYSDYMSPRREGDETDPVGIRLDADQRLQAKETIRNLYKRKEEARKKDSSQPENPQDLESESDDAQSDKISDNLSSESAPEKPYKFMTDDGFGCGAGVMSGFISYDGKLLPCGTTNFPFVNLNDESFPDAWRKVGQLAQEVPSCGECDSCEVAKYCVPCPPKLAAESGSWSKKSAYLCEYAYKLRSYYDKIKSETK